MSYLASPFRYAPTYDVGLNTGTPEVGGTIRRPKNKKTPEEEKTPSRVPNEGKGTGEANGAQSGSANAGAGISASAGMAGAVAQPGSSARSMAAQQENEPTSATNLSQSQFNTLIHPNPISAPANPTKTTVAPAASSPGFWSQVGHDISGIGHNSVVRDVMSFGDPFKSSDTGLAGAINPSYNSSVIQPSQVYSPSRNFPEVSSGRPSVIQGSVEGPGSVGQGAQRAIGRSPVYDANPYGSSLGKQFMGNGSAPVDSSPSPSWIDSIPNDISELFSSVG